MSAEMEQFRRQAQLPLLETRKCLRRLRAAVAKDTMAFQPYFAVLIVGFLTGVGACYSIHDRVLVDRARADGIRRGQNAVQANITEATRDAYFEGAVDALAGRITVSEVRPLPSYSFQSVRHGTRELTVRDFSMDQAPLLEGNIGTAKQSVDLGG